VWIEESKIKALEAETEDMFARDIDVSGDYAIVGSSGVIRKYSTGFGYDFSGAVYILKSDSGKWNILQKIAPANLDSNSYFGYSVAISGDYAIVGSPWEGQVIGGGQLVKSVGSAFIFKNDSGRWVLKQKITASDREPNDRFGYSVAISEDYVLVGGAFADEVDSVSGSMLPNAGSAYIFKNNAGVWTEIKKIRSSDLDAGDNFGHKVAISGDFVFVSAANEEHDENGFNERYKAGSVYIFKDNGGRWSQVQKIVAMDRNIDDCFGCSIAVSEDYALIGAYGNSEDLTGYNSIGEAGAVYVFKNDTGIWHGVQKIIASDRSTNSKFGYSVDIEGDFAIIGAEKNSYTTSSGQDIVEAGAAYIFKNVNGKWAESRKIKASDGIRGDGFGYTVALSNKYVLVGAPYEDEDTSTAPPIYRSGAVYSFKRESSIEVQETHENVKFDLYPNPNTGVFTVYFDTEYKEVWVSISDLTGRTVYSRYYANTQRIPVSLNEPAGVYLMTVRAGDQERVVRLVKE